MAVSGGRPAGVNLDVDTGDSQTLTNNLSLSTSCFSACIGFYRLAFGFGWFGGSFSQGKKPFFTFTLH
jgi:hypothetical protein